MRIPFFEIIFFCYFRWNFFQRRKTRTNYLEFAIILIRNQANAPFAAWQESKVWNAN